MRADVGDGKGIDVVVFTGSVVPVGMTGGGDVVGSDKLGTAIAVSVEMVGLVGSLLIHPFPNIITNNDKTTFNFDMTTFLPIIILSSLASLCFEREYASRSR